jgi:hypothetical protein
MTVKSDTHPIRPDADPALLADKPMTYPPTGNPRIFGPGRRGRTADRASILLHAAVAIFLVLSFTGWADGYDIWPGFDQLTSRYVAIYILVALIAGVTAIWLYHYPLHRMIVRVDDHGVTLRSLGPFHARDRSFVPFDKLKEVRMDRDGRMPPWDILEINLRPGTGWISWKFAALTGTGTEGRKIAEEIVTRAEAAGIVVTPHKGSGLLQGVVRWSFDPKTAADKGNATP